MFTSLVWISGIRSQVLLSAPRDTNSRRTANCEEKPIRLQGFRDQDTLILTGAGPNTVDGFKILHHLG